MGIRVGINGFGRIGRNFFRAQHALGSDIEIVAFNDLGDAKTMAHLLRYDSNLGPFPGEVELADGVLRAAGEELRMLSERDPAALPWGELGVDVVLESTGFFTDRAGAQKHLDAGAKKVVISAPATDPDVTIVLGVNDAAAYVGELAREHDRNVVAARKMVTEAANYGARDAKAIGLVLPELQGKVDGISVRAPVATGSLTDLVVQLGRETTVDEVKGAFRAASTAGLAGILQYSEDPLVSTDIKGSAYSCVFDSELAMVHGSNVKVFGWYDNEWGYSCRLVDVIGKLLP